MIAGRQAPDAPAGATPQQGGPDPDEVLAALTGIDLHRGVLAVAERAAFEPIAPDAYAPAQPPHTVLVCEDITNIDNIGQLFRIAAAFAADLVLLSPSCQLP